MDHSEFLRRLHKILDAAIAADDAALGNIQRIVSGRHELEIVAQRGFSESFLSFFRFVSTDDDSACGRALRYKRRIVIPDITTDRLYAPYADIARAAGYRAVQSTPLISRQGAMLGVLSTHFRNVHYLSRDAVRTIETCAVEAAALMEAHERRSSIRGSESEVSAPGWWSQ